MAHLVAICCFILAALCWGLSAAGGGVLFASVAVVAEAVAWYQLFFRDKSTKTD